METLPDLPSHEGLVCTGWNWTLENLKQTNREMNVAALYVTDDGATSAFMSIPGDCKIYVPKGSLSAYQTADNWNSYASYMEEMEGDVP